MSAPRDWSSFVLLLIDVQRDFRPPDVASALPGFEPAVRELLALAREEGLDVVHLRARFRRDRTDWMPRYLLGRALPCVEGTGGDEPLDCARESPGEPVIVKHGYDGFLAPELDEHLRAHGKRFVLAAGLLTSVCVLLTVASAAQRGYLAAVVEDACADELREHALTLERYADLLFERVPLDGVLARHAAWSRQIRAVEEARSTARNG